MLIFPGFCGFANSLNRIDEIRKPDITKKISTPVNPPIRTVGNA